MEYDQNKVDEMTLALMYLGMSPEPGGGRAWKSFDLQTMDRLHQKGWISELKSKSATVVVSAEGMRKAGELFRRHFQVK
jgi:hypothetical protein